MSAFYGEFLDKRYATKEEFETAWAQWKGEPVICAHCLHPVDYDIDTGNWCHKEQVPWCDRMRNEVPIKPVVNKERL
jgi:hypothetical protein